MEDCKNILQESGNADIPIKIENSIKESCLGTCEGKEFRPGERDEVIEEHQLKLFFTDTFLFTGFPNGETIRLACN